MQTTLLLLVQYHRPPLVEQILVISSPLMNLLYLYRELSNKIALRPFLCVIHDRVNQLPQNFPLAADAPLSGTSKSTVDTTKHKNKGGGRVGPDRGYSNI